MIPPALWLIVLPLGAAPLVYLFRRVGIGAIVAAIVALLLSWLTMGLPLGLAMNVLGRSVELDRLSQLMLALLFLTTTMLFLVSANFVPLISGVRQRTIDASVVSGAGRTFYPISLAILGLLVTASLSRHLGITAIFIEAAAILAVFIIQGSRLESTRAAQRFLVIMSLAMPFFLLAAWRIDQYQASGGAQTSQVIQQTSLFIGLGFALWLALVPFHGGLTATATEASPASAAFILVAFPLVAFLTLIHLFSETPWLFNASQLSWALIIAGGVTACIGGGLTSVQRGLSGLMGYAALYDLGCNLAILGMGGQTAVVTVLVGLTVRALALTLIAAGTSVIRLQLSSDGFAQMSGLARQMPLATAGLLIGGLTLAGAPLTIGFAPRWQLLQLMVEVDPRWPALLTLASLGVAIGYLRALYTLLPGAVTTSTLPRSYRRLALFREPPLLVVIISLLSVICLMLGLFPSLLIELFRELTLNIFFPV